MFPFQVIKSKRLQNASQNSLTEIFRGKKRRRAHNLVNIYLLKVIKRSTRKRCEICSKLQEKHQINFMLYFVYKPVTIHYHICDIKLQISYLTRTVANLYVYQIILLNNQIKSNNKIKLCAVIPGNSIS